MFENTLKGEEKASRSPSHWGTMYLRDSREAILNRLCSVALQGVGEKKNKLALVLPKTIKTTTQTSFFDGGKSAFVGGVHAQRYFVSYCPPRDVVYLVASRDPTIPSSPPPAP